MKTVGRRQMGTQKDGPLQAGVHRIQLTAAKQHATPPLGPSCQSVSLSPFLAHGVTPWADGSLVQVPKFLSW